MTTAGSVRRRAARRACAAALGVFFVAPALAQQAPPAPSLVTPRNLLPPPPVLPSQIAIPRSLPGEAPKGADAIKLTVPSVTIEGGYPDMADASRALLAPLAAREVSVGAIYRAAAALEAAYVRKGYFLARIVVPEQRVTAGTPFRLVVVDGFFEQLQDSGLPWQVRGPVRRTLIGIVGKRRPKLAELERRLAEASAVPGARIRSTLGQGDQPGGARLILDGGFAPFGLSIGADNRLGPAFNTWGINIAGQINSPTGNGEQFYGFLSIQPRLDTAFKRGARRRVGGGGLLLPLTPTGITLNPEFTISDTNPKVANPLFASNGRLYRGAFSLLAPLHFVPVGAASAKLSLVITRETQRLPVFGVDLTKDRLSVLQGTLAWNGALWRGGQFSSALIVSQGIKGFGARTPGSIARAEAPSSRGSDPQFTTAEARIEIDQALAAGLIATVIARGQTAFGSVVPNAYSFDLTGLDSLSSFTAGALNGDGGALVRGELSRPLPIGSGRVRMVATPYAFGAAGKAHYAIDDPLNPGRGTSVGAGLRVSGRGLPFGAGITASLEYGHSHLGGSRAPDDRISTAFGVQF